MSYLPLPTKETATGRVRDLLVDCEERWGFVGNIMRAMALRPEVMEADAVWTQAVMWNGTVDRAPKEEIASLVSVENCVDYCSTAHVTQAERHGAAKGTAEAILGKDLSRFSGAERAVLDFAAKAARDMHSITQQDVDGLRKHFSPGQIVEIALVIGCFQMYNTFVSILGIEIEPERATARPVKLR